MLQSLKVLFESEEEKTIVEVQKGNTIY